MRPDDYSHNPGPDEIRKGIERLENESNWTLAIIWLVILGLALFGLYEFLHWIARHP